MNERTTTNPRRLGRQADLVSRRAPIAAHRTSEVAVRTRGGTPGARRREVQHGLECRAAILDAEHPELAADLEDLFGPATRREAAAAIAERRACFAGPLYVAAIKPYGGKPLSVKVIPPSDLARAVCAMALVGLARVPTSVRADIEWRIQLPGPDQQRALAMVDALRAESYLRPKQ
ncbi:MAG: hypothetical protein AB7P21_07105 [Lautropia sp.]